MNTRKLVFSECHLPCIGPKRSGRPRFATGKACPFLQSTKGRRGLEVTGVQGQHMQGWHWEVKCCVGNQSSQKTEPTHPSALLLLRQTWTQPRARATLVPLEESSPRSVVGRQPPCPDHGAAEEVYTAPSFPLGTVSAIWESDPHTRCRSRTTTVPLHRGSMKIPEWCTFLHS